MVINNISNLIINWGLVDISANSQQIVSGTLTFPYTFANNYVITEAHTSIATVAMYLYNKSNITFQFKDTTTTTHTVRTYLIAIGN